MIVVLERAVINLRLESQNVMALYTAEEQFVQLKDVIETTCRTIGLTFSHFQSNQPTTFRNQPPKKPNSVIAGCSSSEPNRWIENELRIEIESFLSEGKQPALRRIIIGFPKPCRIVWPSRKYSLGIQQAPTDWPRPSDLIAGRRRCCPVHTQKPEINYSIRIVDRGSSTWSWLAD